MTATIFFSLPGAPELLFLLVTHLDLVLRKDVKASFSNRFFTTESHPFTYCYHYAGWSLFAREDGVMFINNQIGGFFTFYR